MLYVPRRDNAHKQNNNALPDSEMPPCKQLVDPVVEHGGRRNDEERTDSHRLVQLSVLVHSPNECRLLTYDVNFRASLLRHSSDKTDDLHIYVGPTDLECESLSQFTSNGNNIQGDTIEI